MKRFWQLLKEAGKEFSQDDTFSLGAALSYYTVFSLAPVLVIVIAVSGLIFGRDAVTGRIYGQISDFLGSQGAKQVQDIVAAAYKPGQTVIATIIAVIVLILGAVGMFTQLQSAIDKIWEVKPKPQERLVRNILKLVRDRLLSFSLLIAIGFLLLVSLVINAALMGLSHQLMRFMPDYSVYLFQALDFIISLAGVTLLFALIYKYLPDARVRWRDVWLGAAVTSVLFTISRFLIGFYLAKTNVASSYGAAGFIVLVLLWVNYSSQILFFGAEFTQVYAKRVGRGIEPNDFSVRVKSVEVKQHEEESADDFEQKVKKVQDICAKKPEKS